MLQVWKAESARMRGGAFAILVLTLMVFLAACDRFGPQSPAEHIQNAVEYRLEGNLNAAIIELKNALQQSPNNVKARVLLGKTYVESGRGQAAEKELRRAISLGVAEVTIAPELAKAMLMQGRYRDVLDTIKPARQSAPARQAEALIIKGDAEQALGKIEPACVDYRQASKLDSKNLFAELGLASCDAAQSRLEQARARVKRLLRQHAEHVPSWVMLGRIEAQAKRSQAAIDAFSKALELSPQQPGALLGRARVELAEHRLKKAAADIEALHKLVPSSVQANHLLGFLRFRQGRFSDAAVAYQDALRVNPNFEPAILWLGLTNYALHNYEQAIQGFSRFLQGHPDAVRVRVLLALSQAQVGGDRAAVQTIRQLQGVAIDDPKMLAAIGQAAVSAGDEDAGRHYLERAVAQAPEKASFRMALAGVLLQSGEVGQAIEELDMAAQLDQKDARADIALIRALIAKRQLDRALPAIDRLQTKLPNSDIPYVLRGLVFLLQKHSDQALKAFTAAVKQDPSSIGGHHGLAVLDIQKQNFAGARKHYQTILDAHPGNLQAELALASLAVKTGDRAQALSWLEQAARDNPQSPIASGLYARELLAQGRAQEALQVTQQAIEAYPKHAGLLYIRGAALLAEGESREAARSYQKLIAVRADFIPARLQLARIREQLNDMQGAREVLNEALEISPHHLGAKVSLLQLELRAKHFNRAMELAQEIEQAHPKRSLGRLFEAQIQAQQGKLPEAIATLRSAAKTHPQSQDVIRALARLQWVTGKQKASAATLAEWVKRHPDDWRLTRELGDRYLLMGRNKAAAELYEKVIEARPRDVEVLNNLALARWPDDPQQSIRLAREANRLRPESPAVQDTLGWMLVEKGQLAQGLPLLESAHELLGDSPSVQYHYAAALARAGKQSAARQALKDLLAANKSFPERRDAQALLEKL